MQDSFNNHKILCRTCFSQHSCRVGLLKKVSVRTDDASHLRPSFLRRGNVSMSEPACHGVPRLPRAPFPIFGLWYAYLRILASDFLNEWFELMWIWVRNVTMQADKIQMAPEKKKDKRKSFSIRKEWLNFWVSSSLLLMW